MKILILGLGSIARKHIRAIRSIDPAAEIFALRSSLHSSPADGVTDLYTEEELSGTHFDFAVLASPTAMHERGLELLGKLNIPLFIEKPLSHTLGVGRKVRELEEKGTLTYVACNLRFLDCIRFTREYIREQRPRVNEVNAYCGSFLPDWRQNGNYREGYSAKAEAGGGVHLDLIHELDYLYWIFGAPEGVRRTFSNRSSLGIRAWDYADYCLRYPSFHAGVVLNYYRRDPKRTLEVVADEGTFSTDLLANRVTRADGTILFESPRTIADTYTDQMAYFTDLVTRGANRSMNSAEDAYNVLEICLGYETER